MSSLTQLAKKPGFRQAPVAGHSFLGNFEDFGRLFDAQTAEEAELYDATLSRVNPGESLESAVQRLNLDPGVLPDTEGFVQRDMRRAAATLLVTSRTCDID